MYDGKNGKGIVVVTDMVNRRLIQIGNHPSLDKKSPLLDLSVFYSKRY